MTWRHGDPVTDAAFKTQEVANDLLKRESKVTPIGHRMMERALKEMEKRLNLSVRQAHVLREPKVAAALEVAEEAVQDARRLLKEER